jgi:hypothetical protein
MKRIFIGLILCLFLFSNVLAQTKLKFSSKFPRKYDSFTVVNGYTILNVFMKVKSNSNTLLKSMSVTYSDTYGKSILSGSSVII